MRKIKKIYIHCSDTPNNRKVKGSTIRCWHLRKGWSDIGYHWVIERDGLTVQGRAESRIGAGVYGHNRDSIHICVVGRNRYTTHQTESLIRLILEIIERHPIEEVLGHYESDLGKTCPNIDMDQFREDWALSKEHLQNYTNGNNANGTGES